MLEMKEWDGFEGRLWKEEINVRQFIQDNTHHMMVTRISLQNLQRLPISFGEFMLDLHILRLEIFKQHLS